MCEDPASSKWRDQIEAERSLQAEQGMAIGGGGASPRDIDLGLSEPAEPALDELSNMDGLMVGYAKSGRGDKVKEPKQQPNPPAPKPVKEKPVEKPPWEK